MSQQSPSAEIESTWGTFANQQAAEAVKTELEKAGIEQEKITLEVEDAQPPIRLEDTEAIANIKYGAITGGVLGALVGLSISLIMTNFASVGLSALKNFQTIHYFAPILGAIVGAAGISLISGLSGASIVRPKEEISDRYESRRYIVAVKGNADQVNLAKEVIDRQGGAIEEANRR